jgi:hypothetical protein
MVPTVWYSVYMDIKDYEGIIKPGILIKAYGLTYTVMTVGKSGCLLHMTGKETNPFWYRLEDLVLALHQGKAKIDITTEISESLNRIINE